jgi:pyruvate ferredoxin oxidoreductase gamma subunit
MGPGQGVRNVVEIRWHGRGGQGAKTASQLLAMAQLQQGWSVQAFPEYGPERAGAPMRAFNRADTRPIRRHYGVDAPGVVVVLDDSLLREVPVAEGLAPGGLLIANTELAPEAVRRLTGHPGPVWCIPADRLARQAGGAYPNVVLLGAVAQALGDLPPEALEGAIRELMGGRLSPAKLEQTLEATRLGRAWAQGRWAA